MLDIIIVRTKFVAISAKYLIRVSALVNEVKFLGVSSHVYVYQHTYYTNVICTYVPSSRILGSINNIAQ